MNIRIPHGTTKNEAIERVKKMIEESRDTIAENATEVKEEWRDNVLSFGFVAQGQRIEGILAVHESEYELNAKLPLALRLFEGTIERMIESEAKKLKL